MIKDKIIEEESRDICRSSLEMLFGIMMNAGLVIHDLYSDVMSEEERGAFNHIMAWIYSYISRNELDKEKEH